jgi:hypothetical protein
MILKTTKIILLREKPKKSSWNILDTYGLSEESVEEIRKIFEPNLEEYYNSSWDWEESWRESGEIDPTSRKTGGFVPNYSTE